MLNRQIKDNKNFFSTAFDIQCCITTLKVKCLQIFKILGTKIALPCHWSSIYNWERQKRNWNENNDDRFPEC
jgi:hypothetical protein